MKNLFGDLIYHPAPHFVRSTPPILGGEFCFTVCQVYCPPETGGQAAFADGITLLVPVEWRPESSHRVLPLGVLPLEQLRRVLLRVESLRHVLSSELPMRGWLPGPVQQWRPWHSDAF